MSEATNFVLEMCAQKLMSSEGELMRGTIDKDTSGNGTIEGSGQVVAGMVVTEEGIGEVGTQVTKGKAPRKGEPTDHRGGSTPVRLGWMRVATPEVSLTRVRVFLAKQNQRSSHSVTNSSHTSIQISRLSYHTMEEEEHRCFIGNLSWSTTDRGLKQAFEKFGHVLDAKVVIDKSSGRSRGFGFVSFESEKEMEDAIEEMNGMDLDGRAITVDRSQPNQGSGRDRDGGRDRDRDRDRGRDRDRDYGTGRGSGGDCFKCGKPGHFARECPSGEGSRGSRYGGRDDKYGGGSRYGPDRNGDRSGGRNRDGGSRGGPGNDRYNRDRSGPYERRGPGGYRS
ncbi:unnamed protein product [Ilex paraguariensis]|uniref:Glycine-rich RNA-binding protein RZ1A n=1 Tax=Ilex paraguariensis TaxID=185542 RepID=A0ABC8V3I6_9AQUA